MSFDLSFYTKKGSNFSETSLRNYLASKAFENNPEASEWVMENDATRVYYSFSYFKLENLDEEDENYVSTGFDFNLNFVRPDFFGMEAFLFVEEFIDKFDLYVMNPQSSGEVEKPAKGQLYESWYKTNETFCKKFYKEHNNLKYCPKDKADHAWQYNFIKADYQRKLGEDTYFVPKILFFENSLNGEIQTVSVWPYNAPLVFPKVDFFLLDRKVKKLFKTVQELGVVNYDKIMTEFKEYMEPYEIEGTFIIHPNNSAKIQSKFNSIKFDYTQEQFGYQAAIETMVNHR
jgi:hypothetical protein